ncbi:hypothetical protein D9M71_490990 [compost metagenome]
MGLFSTILAKLGFGEEAQAAPVEPSAPPASTPATSAPVATAGMALVDVVAKLEALAAASPEKLNWKTSIVDLLKLLGMDSSLTARKALASELGCPPEKMADSAQMNMWLHKSVLQKLADNGGNVPAELLD